MNIIISPKIGRKLAEKEPPVTRDDIEQCFANRTGSLLYDMREENASDPPTKWFIAQTDFRRYLKVVFIPKDGDIYIRTAYSPNEIEFEIYLTHGRPSL